jgi:transposase-like protein
MGPHWESHLREAQEEDVAFLVDAGLTVAEACERVGIDPSTLRLRGKRREHGRG